MIRDIPGRSSRAGYTEAALVLSIARAIGPMLVSHGHRVVYTRTGDIEDDGFAFRADITNAAQADVFLSTHCNAAASSLAYGVETYHYPGSYQGRRLANAFKTNWPRLPCCT